MLTGLVITGPSRETGESDSEVVLEVAHPARKTPVNVNTAILRKVLEVCGRRLRVVECIN
jgi:hypothetical protein